MKSGLKTIAVDLTPVLPGGANGGAKVFVLTLLSELAAMLPEVHFILLTQAASHDALAFLDRPNMVRVTVLSQSAKQSLRHKIASFASSGLARLPDRLTHRINQMGLVINTWFKRGRVNAWMKTKSIDLLFCPFTAPTYHEEGVPTVCTLYDLQYKTFPQFFEGQDVAHRDYVFQSACKKATKLVAISDYTRNSAILHGGLDPSQVITIYLRMANRLSSELRAAEGILDRFELIQGQYFLYPANSWRHKNHEILLTAFAMFRHQNPSFNIKLICTGAPDDRQKWLIKMAQRLHLKEFFYFPDYLNSDELSQLMHNACALIFPSLYEGFGLPIIEAMAAGVPVACSNTTSLPEIAGDAALFFDPQNPTTIVAAMRALFTDENLRTTLIEKGRQRAIMFADTKQMAEEYWTLFEAAFQGISMSRTGYPELQSI